MKGRGNKPPLSAPNRPATWFARRRAGRHKKLLSVALAFALAAASPLQGSVAYAATPGAEEAAPAAETIPIKPNLPQGFGSPLEDNDGLTVTSEASVAALPGFGNAIDVTTHWNNQDNGHASINNAASLFQKTAFTVLFDVRQDAPTQDTDVTDKRVAMTIGAAANSIQLLTYSGKFGYGSQNGGVSANLSSLSGVEKDDWNAVAMTYEEPEGGNGRIAVYINGEKAGEAADIGFKLSSMDGLAAMIGRTFGTSYIQQGRYDNLVVGNTALNEDLAKAETKYRKYAKDNMGSDTPVPGATEITVKGGDVDNASKNINGLTYKGFGMLNGNSTSNLLLDYKSKSPAQYQEMMQYLFGGDYPLFTHIKMEMGNDGNNSTGAEACTMRYEDEEADASRSPGFVMAADAKKINPDVKISILRWEMPGWVAAKWNNNTNNQGYEAVYKWYKETVFDAYEKYGYMVDFINPDKNETGNPDVEFIKWFSNRIENETEFPSYIGTEAQAAYKAIRIIASDENKGLKIVPAMRADQELYNAVDIIGFHYRTNATDDYVRMADVDDKEVWYSEGCATFGYSELQENKTIEYGAGAIGGYQSPLALMDSFITAFDASRRTHYMFQPAIGSFYEGIQYGHKELLSARDPWSGYIHYDPALYMLQHFAKFAKTGWEDSNPGANDIWRVIPAATDGAFAGSDNEHATAGIDGNAGYMTLASPDKKDFSVVLVNNTRNPKSFVIRATDMAVPANTDLHFWVTETDRYMQDKGTLEKTDNGWLVTLPAYSVSTATTLATKPERTPKEEIHNQDRHVLDTDATGATNGVATDSVLYADDFEYEEEEPGYLEARGNEPRYMLDTHGAWIVENGELKHELANSVAQWNGGEPSTVVGDFRWMDYSASVDIRIPDAAESVFARLTIRSQSGMNWNNSGYTLSINGSGKWELYRIGTKIANGAADKDPEGKYNVKLMSLGDLICVEINGKHATTYQDPVPMRSGRVKLSSSWSQVYFDNLLIETIEGGIPYALSMVDGQDDCVSYEGNWTIDQPGGGSADNWYRTMSVTSSANASFSFPIQGCGFAILGTNNGSARLNVYVDNTLVAENVATLASPIRGETYMLSDLDEGQHTIKVVVTSGTLNIDALYAMGKRIEAKNTNILVSVKPENLPSFDAYLTGQSLDSLPKQVDVLTSSGETVKKDIVWNTNTSHIQGNYFQSASITGTVLGGVNAFGLPLTVSIPIHLVVQKGTVYLIDSIEANPANNPESATYEKVKSLLGSQLLNQTSDQYKESNNTWGLVDKDAGTKGYDGNTSDMTATGIYGAKNERGETLSYAFTLPAGDYQLISAHREWWNGPRPMDASLTYQGKTQAAGSIQLTKDGGDILHTAAFTLDSEQLVTYTLTCTGSEAPVISWLAVIEAETPSTHTHSYTYKADNGDGTHTCICKDGDDSYTEAHTYQNGACTVCGAKATKPPVHTHTYAYKDNGNGTHTVSCTGCNVTRTEAHTYQNDVCTRCKAKKPVSLAKPSTPSLSNGSSGVKVTWKKVSGASGYYIERKSGSGKWTQAKKITKGSTLSWTDKKASKNGTKYQYRVTAYKGSTKSKVSSAKAILRLDTAKISSAKNTKGKKLALKWARNKKAGGYQIQYSTSKKFSKPKSIKVSSSSKTSRTITSGLKKGKRYYIRIRSYKKSGKTTYYSAWSKVKNVKISK